MRQPIGYRESTLPERFGRKLTITHAATVGVIAIMALAAYLTLDRAIHIQRESATAIGLTDRERVLSQRIASLTAQYALGNIAVGHDLRSAINAFESTHWRLVAGDPNAGMPSVVSVAPLKAIYFGGSAPLDAAAAEFVTRARRVTAMSPQDRSLATQTAPVFLAAQQSLADGLDAAASTRQNRSDGQLTILRIIGAALCLSTLVTLLAAVLAVFRPMARRIVRLTRIAGDLVPLATTDPLTGTLNKRSFQARGAIEIQKARRYQRPLSLLMIDADQLPAIEGAHGADGGETLLKALTSSFFAGTRISDLVGRVDAEQFAILLPETGSAGAQVIAERLRLRISDLAVPIDDKLVSCTVSIGVAAAEKDASFLWPTFKRADEALYEAKMSGRNRVVVAAAA